jgi:hypothetical protein
MRAQIVDSVEITVGLSEKPIGEERHCPSGEMAMRCNSCQGFVWPWKKVCPKCGMPLIAVVSPAEPDDVFADMDRRFKRTMVHAESAYRTNYWINLVIVAFGIVFLSSSLYFSYDRGIDASTLSYAGLGIVDFVALFLVNPQRSIQQIIADLNQIMVVYRTYRSQLSMLDGYGWDQYGYKTLSLDEIERLNILLGKIAEESLSALERYIGAERK